MFSGINYVYEVYRTQSFSKAAKNLYISQPSLSAMIKKIEAKVGAPLFDRSTNPIQLTEYGEQYIRIAEKIMDLEDEFAYYTDNLNELKTGHLSIGTTSFFASYILPKYISQFSAAYPHVKVIFTRPIPRPWHRRPPSMRWTWSSTIFTPATTSTVTGF